MGGYNSLLEEVGIGKQAIVVPRVLLLSEQFLRASRFAQLGLVEEVIRPDVLSGQTLATAIQKALSSQHVPPDPSPLDLGGVDRVCGVIQGILSDDDWRHPTWSASRAGRCNPGPVSR